VLLRPDGRVTIVEATSASVPLKKSVERIWADLEKLTVGSFSEAERADALAALESLEHNLLAVEPRVITDE